MDRLFTSDKNYMKRSSASVSTAMLGPNVSRFGGTYFTRELNIPHGLGYSPLFRTFYEPLLDGKIFECFTDTARGIPNPVNTYGGTLVGPTGLCWVDDTYINTELAFPDSTLSGSSYPLHVVVYRDYGLSAILDDKRAEDSDYKMDRIVSQFEGNTTNHSVAAATPSGGGVYLPKTDILVIPNPYGKKALPTMCYSFNGSRFYPQRYRLYQPGDPVPAGLMGAVVGMAVDDTSIYFYFTHYYGAQVNFTMFWTLDVIE